VGAGVLVAGAGSAAAVALAIVAVADGASLVTSVGATAAVDGDGTGVVMATWAVGRVGATLTADAHALLKSSTSTIASPNRSLYVDKPCTP
jgi:hypothetical protein